MSFKSRSSGLEGGREIASAGPKERSSANNDARTDEMAKYGITRITVDYFDYREFRYTSLKDALAQAKREQSLG